ncbi:MAG TPA: ParB/RepB/Spo0J family partition protein [Candidatus Acidoferrales bacterium]|nr:ParB/RepB/Spo0J family partition protein [Candidatus Acidoferrales bacterium]
MFNLRNGGLRPRHHRCCFALVAQSSTTALVSQLLEEFRRKEIPWWYCHHEPTPEEVRDAILEWRFQEESNDGKDCKALGCQWHIERLAYLMVHTDLLDPIEMKPNGEIANGAHRLLAHHLLGLEYIATAQKQPR